MAAPDRYLFNLMCLKFKCITERRQDRKDSEAFSSETSVCCLLHLGVKWIDPAIDIINTDIPDAFESPFGRASEVDSKIQPVVGRQCDVVRPFINQFRITGVRDARQGRSLNVLGGHRCAVSTVVSPCSITVNSLIELVTERKVQLVPVVKLPGIPVRIEVLEFFFCP